jgi:glycosyltransferase involved in cell wall biosynthesis
MSTVLYRSESPYVPQPVAASAPSERLAGRPASDRPLRVLVPSYRSDKLTGGQGVYLFYFTRALADLGHSVDVISGPPYPELDPRVRLISLPSLDLYARPKFWGGFPALPIAEVRGPLDLYEYLAHISGAFPEPFTFGERLAHYMRGRVHDYDLVHDNQTLSRGLLKLERWGLPVVGTIHHPITMDRRLAIEAAETFGLKLLTRRWFGFLRMQAQVARRLKSITVCSESTRRDAARDFALEPSRLSLVPLGVDTRVFRPVPGVERDPDLLVATASADVALKGLIYLVEAYAKLLATRPRLKLQVVGTLRDGPTRKRLGELGILDRVRFMSGIAREELVRLYCRAAIVVSPSVYEGFGFPAAEAMACGTPVVATTGGSLPEIVGEAGVLVPTRDAGALAAAISGLLDDPVRRRALSARGRERIVRRFTWEKSAGAAIEVYQRALTHADD